MRGHHYDEQIYFGQIVLEVKQTVLCALERGISEEAKAVMNRMICVACTATGSHGEVLSRATS